MALVQDAWNEGDSVRGSDNASDELEFIITEAVDRDDALNSLAEYAPILLGSHIRQETSVRRITDDTYLGTARYGVKQNQSQDGATTFHFSTGGGHEHITQSIRTVGIYTSQTPTAQVVTCTVILPFKTDIFTLTVNGQAAQVTAPNTFNPADAGAVGVQQELVASLIVTAWNNANLSNSTGVNISQDGNQITLTAQQAGVPFTVSTSAVQGDNLVPNPPGADLENPNTQQFNHTVTVPNGGGGPDHGGAIGVTRDSVEGCDINARRFEFSITKVYSIGDIDGDVIAALYLATATANDSEVVLNILGQPMTFGRRDLILLNVQGGDKNAQQCEFVFTFSATPTVTGRSCGDIFGIAKRGNDYLWVQYHDEEDEQARAIVKRPFAVYTEQVYYETDMNTLFEALGLLWIPE